MELYHEILIHALQKQNATVTFPDLKVSATEIVDLQSYQALKKIKAVIEDDSLTDQDCFLKIEEIICVFEQLGCYTGIRHDQA